MLGNIAKWGVNMGARALFKRGLNAGSKAISSEICKKLIHEVIKHAPELYKLGTSKVKSKNVRRALNYDVANYIVQETQKKGKKRLKQSLWWGIKND